jgi:hypothetical protein
MKDLLFEGSEAPRFVHTAMGVPATDEPHEGAVFERRIFWEDPEPGWNRRSFFALVGAVGAGIGLVMVGVFPKARQALADGYTIKDEPCPAGNTGDQCSPGCGDSPVCGGGSDGPCCENGSNFWHLSGAQGGDAYRLRPNECYAGTYDGWKWGFAPCGGCDSVVFRCHDGKKRQGDGTYDPDICRHAVFCFQN